MKHLYEYITARDGIRLASDVYLPRPQGRFPTVVLRTPYGKYDQRCVAYAEWMAEHGYAVVIQDVRGRYDSDGVWHPYDNHEDTDGHDTVEWISTQIWSNGNVAFSGSSYLAFTGYMAAMGGHPALKALVARVPATGLYHHHFYMGGIFSLARLVWGTLVGRRVQQVSLKDGRPVFTFEKLIREDPDCLLHLPVVEIGERFALPIPWWRTWLQHETEDQYWYKMEIIRHFNRIRIPVYHVGGWHDDFCSVSIENFLTARGFPAASEQRLLMGMWPHQLNMRADYGGIDYGSEAVIDLFAREKRFLDPYMLDTAHGPMDEPPVRIFIMGINKWRNYDSWPPKSVEKKPLYLHPGGVLDWRVPGLEKAASYVYDPAEHTPQPWDYGEPDLPVVPGHGLDASDRSDRLLYATLPLDKPLGLVGPISLTLYAATDAPDTDWFAWLAWEDPQKGRIRLLTYGGSLRSRFRFGFDCPQLLRPGEIYDYHIPLGHTARVLPAGARIHLCLQSSAKPYYSRNLNTGGDNYRDTTIRKAIQSVYQDASHPSHVLVSILSG
ncbi:MAG: CocE/NonD family hydrolase [Deltaproteobacteria bacterium]|nr:CocE/NonD family hydrolase [Deltaproteobacteria bacterium]